MGWIANSLILIGESNLTILPNELRTQENIEKEKSLKWCIECSIGRIRKWHFAHTQYLQDWSSNSRTHYTVIQLWQLISMLPFWHNHKHYNTSIDGCDESV